MVPTSERQSSAKHCGHTLEAMADLQAAYDDRDRALAEHLGIGRTYLRCLDLIMRGGPQTASGLGAQLHLTRGR